MSEPSYDSRQLQHMRDVMRRYQDGQIELPDLMKGLGDLAACLENPAPEWKAE